MTTPIDLIAEGLTVKLGGAAVVDNVTLTFCPGKVTAVVGPNGAGKSTLMTCLAGVRRPGAGIVRLGDAPLPELTDRRRAQAIGYLPQTPEVAWPLDVRTFVCLGRTAHRGLFGAGPADVRAVDQALEATGLKTFADRIVTTLSGGERARVLIARALAGEPSWLLADEPLTGLDVGHQLDTAVLLRRIADAGAGVIVTLHDLHFAARAADRLVVMVAGRVIADDAPVDALTPKVLATAYGLDAHWVEGADGPLLDVAWRRTAPRD